MSTFKRKCIKCGVEFLYGPGEDWKKICISCWIKQKNQRDFQDQFNNYFNQKTKEQKSDFFRRHFGQDYEDFFNFGGRTGRAQERAESHSGFEAEFQENLRALLMLCHPDRHDNSDLSNRITKWLLSKRR